MVPFVDLKSQYMGIRQEILDAVAGVLDSGQYVLGSEVAAFEKEFAAFSGAAHGVAVNSGTSALHLALLTAGVGRGDEVITIPFTFVATVASIYYTGATPVFVDVDPVSYTMDVAQVEAAITPRTKAILPVHLYGQMADMDALRTIAKKHNLVLIEDAAQAHGAEYNGARAGSLGDMACFSFYPGKNLGAYGEGGMVVTNNAESARMLRMLRDWGAEKKYEHVLKGYNYRMEGVQGAILRVKLRHLEAWTEGRRQAAAWYEEMMGDAGVARPVEVSGRRHVYHVYGVMTPQRAGLMKHLNDRGVQTGIHYPIPVHLLPAYEDLGYKQGQFPVSERLANQELSLPMYPEITREHVRTVCEAVGAFAGAVPA